MLRGKPIPYSNRKSNRRRENRMDHGEQAARDIIADGIAAKIRQLPEQERRTLIRELLTLIDTEKLVEFSVKYDTEPKASEPFPFTTSLKLLLDGDMTTTTSPDRITALLGANSDAETIQLVNCRAQQFLDFLLEMQQGVCDLQ
jgi:hypothetical protein